MGIKDKEQTKIKINYILYIHIVTVGINNAISNNKFNLIYLILFYRMIFLLCVILDVLSTNLFTMLHPFYK